MFAKPRPIHSYLFRVQPLRNRLRCPRSAAGLLCLAVGVLLTAGVAPAQVQVTYPAPCMVTSGADSGPGTLRDALDPSKWPPCYNIKFDNDYTIHLTSPLGIKSPATIDGAGHRIVLSGDGNVQILRVSANTVLRNLTFSKGYCGSDCVHYDLYFNPPLAVAGGGGAIYIGPAPHDVNIENCLFSDNIASYTGGAIHMGTGAKLDVFSTSFIGNTAAFWGGAIGTGTRGVNRTRELSVSSSRFVNNSAVYGGAIGGDMTRPAVNSSSFVGNHAGQNGGAIYTPLTRGWLFVTNSTFYGNAAGNVGGGVTLGSASFVTNCTFAGNRATGSGGGIIVQSPPFPDPSSGLGAVVRNTLIVGSTGGNCAGYGFERGSTHNLADDNSCGASFTNSPSVLLGPLGFYGVLNPGFATAPIETETMPLLPGSAALDAADPAVCAESFYRNPYDMIISVRNKDQRYIDRPQGAGCDIGAFESRGIAEATDQTARLIALVADFNLKQGISNSLDSKLRNAQAAMTAANAGDRSNACNLMTAFINDTNAQSGKALTVDQVNQLVIAAGTVRLLLACR